MGMASGPDDARRHTEQLQEQIAADRRDLVRTIAALHEKTDVKKRVRERAVGAEIAVADLAGRAGRTAGAVPRFVRWVAAALSDQARKAPKPARAPVGQVAGLLRQRFRLLLALWTAVVAVLAMRRWRRG